MSGTEISIPWRGRTARAWMPEQLSARNLEPTSDSVRRAERAGASVRRAADLLPPHWEPLARLLLRAEGVASSNIEGLRAPVALVAAAELDPDAVGATEAWIADNLAAVDAALADASSDALDVSTLHRWHRELMRHSPLPEELVGAFRTAQGWIGGTSPLDAVFVPPPPDRVPELVEDLLAFVARDDVDGVTQAAVAHAQFETIHPYGDGNGRIGRILVGWILVRRERVPVPPPVSVLIARDPGGYLSGLYQFRAGSLDAWVGWFADVTRASAEATIAFTAQIGALLDVWRDRLAPLRAHASARALLEILPGHPVMSSASIAGALGVSERTARNALEVLARHGILEPFEMAPAKRGRPRHWWIARELIDTVTVWSG